MYYSDLHIHSRFARATSKHLTVLELYKWAKIKGIYLLGTGDILHPSWIKEFKEYTHLDSNTGFYVLNKEYKKDVKKELPKSVVDKPVYFVPTVETSHIYKQGDKVRRIHIVLVLKDLEVATKLSNKLSNVSKVTADGRPIFGLKLRDITEMVLDLNSSNFVFPAHVWTPYFAVFGSKSGFDSIKEAFGDMAPYITALETGLSSDPEMNRLISALDKYVLISNSDAHSAQRIGREANIHTKLDSYEDLLNTLKTGENLYGTIEYFPEEGRYHFDGHRDCNVVLHPTKAKELDNLCPKCGKKLTLGVMHRVYDLADREEPSEELLNKYRTVSLVPLDDVLSNVLGVGKSSKRLQAKYFEIIEKFGPELEFLQNVPVQNIKNYDSLLGCAIERMRNKDLEINPGYDGVYGVVHINLKDCKANKQDQNLRFAV